MATEIVDLIIPAIFVAEIQILAPGDGSQVISPVEITARLQPGADGHVVAELSDAAGRVLVRQLLAVNAVELVMELPFEVSRPPLPARLTLRTIDSYGRTQALNSVELMLLAQGEATILPAGEQAQITIAEPAEGQHVPNGDVIIRGTAYTASYRPLSIQLITREGRVLAVREVYVQGDLNRPALFEAVFNISVNEPTWVQVAVTETGRSIPGPAHFSAIEILLVP